MKWLARVRKLQASYELLLQNKRPQTRLIYSPVSRIQFQLNNPSMALLACFEGRASLLEIQVSAEQLGHMYRQYSFINFTALVSDKR